MNIIKNLGVLYYDCILISWAIERFRLLGDEIEPV